MHNLDVGLDGQCVDLVITDVPYGLETHWQGQAGGEADPIANLLQSLRPILSTRSIVALVFNRQQKFNYESYRSLRLLKAGKRRVRFLTPGGTILE